jgi:hypothetical protein
MTFKLIERVINIENAGKLFTREEIARIMEKSGPDFFFGFIYEHVTNTAGFNFSLDELDTYIKKYNRDLVGDTQSEIYSMTPQLETNSKNLVSYQMILNKDTPQLIQENYKLYLLMKK